MLIVFGNDDNIFLKFLIPDLDVLGREIKTKNVFSQKRHIWVIKVFSKKDFKLNFCENMFSQEIYQSRRLGDRFFKPFPVMQKIKYKYPQINFIYVHISEHCTLMVLEAVGGLRPPWF